MKSTVYFSREITPEKVLELYKLLDKKLEAKVAIKVHSGETGNQNFLRPTFWKPLIEHVGGTVVEANTAYKGTRNTTTKHLVTIREHGWNSDFDVEIIDDEGPDEVFEIPNGKVIQKRGELGACANDYTLQKNKINEKSTEINSLKYKKEDKWANAVKAIVYGFTSGGFTLGGMDITIYTEVLPSAGFGITTAIKVACAVAIIILITLRGVIPVTTSITETANCPTKNPMKYTSIIIFVIVRWILIHCFFSSAVAWRTGESR